MLLAIVAPVTQDDLEDGSVDRVYVTTTLPAARLSRSLVGGLMCDDVSRVPAETARKLAAQPQIGQGNVWLLAWD